MLPHYAATLTQAFIELAPDRANEIRDIMAQMDQTLFSAEGRVRRGGAGIYAANLWIEDLREMPGFIGRQPVADWFERNPKSRANP